MAETIVNKLKGIRNELAEVYKNKAQDSEEDKGELNEIHNAILSIEEALKKLRKQAEQEQPITISS